MSERHEVRVADLVDLRSYDGPPDERAAVIAVHVGSGSALSLVPRPEWPRLTSLRSRRDGDGFVLVARFARPAPVAEVVAEVGRQAVWPSVVGVRPGLDLRVFNPIGFRPDWDRGVVDLPPGPPTGAMVRSLRDAQGVRVTASSDPGAVAALAMAGVPLVGPGFPDVDLDDPLAREEHSLVLRRAAIDEHGSIDWQRPVSVLLATRRPEQLDFALSQVARQRGVSSLQLVLAPHGFDVDPGAVRDAVGIDVRVVPATADTVFGDVLNDAARAADGDVLLKMDDDDWYSPDVVADLLRARAYSGAELTGMPAEFHYLAPRDLTVKRGHPTEFYARFVAGGTLLVDRSVLREVGGFRSVRKYVDAQLLAAVTAAGGAIYRTHGLGYVLRRNETGHTWQVDMDYLLDPSRVQRTWDGLTPSRLMEL
ncbi:MAG TPA: glycosyltransferase [Nocardioides sp.]|nr:glycosyltransferase [Nocardioides sp.]